MSAPNFWLMDDFDLYVMGDYDVCVAMLGTEDEEGNTIEEYSIADAEIAWDWFYEEICDYSIQKAIEDLNDGLKWFKVELKSGYYSGVQIYVDTDYVQIEKWDDEDAQYELDLDTVEDVKRLIEEEKKTINTFLANSTDYGFKRVICDGIFSNGEAIYHYAK